MAKNLKTKKETNAADAAKINTLWLFKGAAEQKNYKAEFVGVKTRAVVRAEVLKTSKEMT